MLHEYGQIEGPVWADGCSHKQEDYVCSFEFLESVGEFGKSKHEMVKYDLYVYDSQCGSNNNSHLCIRFGNKPSDCYWPRSIIETSLSAHLMPHCLRALRLMQELGTVTYKPKQRGD